MYILSLHNAEDASLCLMRDGQLLDAISEERLCRQKLYKGTPDLSLDHVLSRHGLSLADIDHVVYGWNAHRHDYQAYLLKLLKRLEQAASPAQISLVHHRYDVEFDRDTAVREEFSDWIQAKGVPSERISYFDHHSTHAWSAFATSPFEQAFIFTLDARGDMKSGSVSLGDRKRGVVEQDFNLPFDSLGFLYGQVTHYLGYKPHRHEGKVTGLAAHGKPERTLPVFERMIRFNDGELRSNLGFYRPFFTELAPELAAELKAFSPEDIAAGVQVHCERTVTAWIRHWIARLDRPEIRNVCLSGGFFANVLANQRIADLAEVDNIYVSPHMGDGGLVIGAAAWKHFAETGCAKVEMPTVYLGPSYTDAEIEAVLKSHQAAGSLSYRRLDDKVGTVIEDIRANRIIGYFDNRMEWGPRALGARSILYHAQDQSVNEWLNKRLHRTEFMPFAPVTPVELADQCYKGWQPDHIAAEFMTRTYDCTEAFIKDHPAVTHIDGTARPQIVSADRHGDYYRILHAYCAATGHKALINTSFNQHEEPIVCSPEDAIGSLLNDNVDALVIGAFRAIKA